MKRAILGPLIFSLVIVGVLLLFKISSITINKIDFVLSACITCVVTLTGFILTSVSIVVGLSGSGIMKKISRTGNLSELVSRYIVTLVLSLLLLIIFIALGATIGKDNMVSSMCLLVGAGISSSYLYSLISTCFYLLRIISKIPEEYVETSDKASAPEGEYRTNENV